MAGKDDVSPETGPPESVSPEEADRLASRFTPLWEEEHTPGPPSDEPSDLTPPHSPAASRARSESVPDTEERTNAATRPQSTTPRARSITERAIPPPQGQDAQPAPPVSAPPAGSAEPAAKRRRQNTLMGIQAPTGDPVASSRPPPAPNADASAPRIPAAARTILGMAPPVEDTEVLLPEHKAEYAPPATLPAPVRNADLSAPAVAVREDPAHAATTANDAASQRHARSVRQTDPPKRIPDPLPRSLPPRRGRKIVTGIVIAAGALAFIAGVMTLAGHSDEDTAVSEDDEALPDTQAAANRPPATAPAGRPTAPATALVEEEGTAPPTPTEEASAAADNRVDTAGEPHRSDEKSPSERVVRAAPPKKSSPPPSAPTNVEKKVKPKPRKPQAKPSRPKPRGGAIVRETPF